MKTMINVLQNRTIVLFNSTGVFMDVGMIAVMTVSIPLTIIVLLGLIYMIFSAIEGD